MFAFGAKSRAATASNTTRWVQSKTDAMDVKLACAQSEHRHPIDGSCARADVGADVGGGTRTYPEPTQWQGARSPRRFPSHLAMQAKQAPDL